MSNRTARVMCFILLGFFLLVTVSASGMDSPFMNDNGNWIRNALAYSSYSQNPSFIKSSPFWFSVYARPSVSYDFGFTSFYALYPMSSLNAFYVNRPSQFTPYQYYPQGTPFFTTYPFTAVAAPEVSVPDVVGEDRNDAMAVITNAYLSVGTVYYESSETVPQGAVIEQIPAAGAMVVRWTRVDLVVSSGP
ncbi:MAG: PASTA domain-containing protein [bacterium]